LTSHGSSVLNLSKIDESRTGLRLTIRTSLRLTSHGSSVLNLSKIDESRIKNRRITKREVALAHLHSCLDILVEEGVFACAFCIQKRDDDDSMLCCSECHVSRFCNVECQKQAYKKSMMASLHMVVPHRKLCPLLCLWKRVKRGRQSVESCAPLLASFLSDCYPFQELCTRNLDEVDRLNTRPS